MSILVTHLVPQGLIFAADRNITSSLSIPGAVTLRGQTQRPKVLKWPNAEVLVVYVGSGAIGDKPTDLWLYDFIGRNLNGADLAELAAALTKDLNDARSRRELDPAEPLILHLGGFEQAMGEWVPRIWFIHNTWGLTADGSYEAGAIFRASEEISREVYFGSNTGDQIYAKVVQAVSGGGLFSFRQGFDLAAFNILDDAIRSGLYTLTRAHPTSPHPVPTTLHEWEKHVRMSVLTYSAYFGAFYEAFEQYVGGGADVMSVSWPGR